MAECSQQQRRSPSDPTPSTKIPTGLGQEPLNIVVLGASFAGLSCAHHFLDHTINQLRITTTSPNYRIVLINPSTHLYWNIAAPRALVSPNLLAHDDLFFAIEPGFHRHRGHNFSIIQGEAIALDPSARTLTIELIGSTAQKRASLVNKRNSKLMTPSSRLSMNMKVQTISYHALIMATGTSAHSDLLSLHGPHFNTIGALNSFHARVLAAKSIIVCGGGCSGVETAGQLATFLNYRSHFPFRRRAKQPKTIILITGKARCLTNHKPRVSQKAEKMLKRLGVEIRHGVRVIAAKEGFDLTGQTRVELNDSTSLIADLYIACTGVEPNSSYCPVEMLDEQRYVVTNKSTLRVDHPLAGARVYCIGDVASNSRNYVFDVYCAVPVLMHNLLNDLLAHEYHLVSPYGGNQDKIDELVDESYAQTDTRFQLCPINKFGGVGILFGASVPGFLVYLFKGRDYNVSKAKKVVVDGGIPFAINGKYL